MVSHVYGVVTKSISARIGSPYCNEKRKIRLAQFLCNTPPLSGSFSKRENYFISRTIRDYSRNRLGKAKLIVLGESFAESIGNIVYEYDGNGCFDNSLMQGIVREVGTLSGEKWGYFIETDLAVIENLRRHREYELMEQEKLSIDGFGFDYLSYSTHLLNEDKKAGKTITRGYQL